MTKLYQAIASAFVARQNCVASDNHEWRDNHENRIHMLVRDHMPRGAGWDSGTKFDISASKPDKLIFYGEFHHMNEHGYYDGWTSHTIIVRPSFDGIEVKVTGGNREQIKEYLSDLFYEALTQESADNFAECR